MVKVIKCNDQYLVFCDKSLVGQFDTLNAVIIFVMELGVHAVWEI